MSASIITGTMEIDAQPANDNAAPPFQLLRGDALKLLADLPSESIDAVITDPPYGTTQAAWDTAPNLSAMWDAFRRVLKPDGVVLMTASQPFTSELVMSNRRWFRCEWIWNKVYGSNFLNAKKQPLKVHESVLVFAPRQPTYHPQMTTGHKPYRVTPSSAPTTLYGRYTKSLRESQGERYPTSIQTFKRIANGRGNGRVHPSQKPVDLMEYMIRTYSDPGDLVLDPFAGSGTTLVAAIRTGRRAIGFEMVPEIADVAERRLLLAQDAAGPLQHGLAAEARHKPAGIA